MIQRGTIKVLSLCLSLGFALYSLGKYQEAIQCYDESLKIKPTSIRYYNKCTFIIYPSMCIRIIKQTVGSRRMSEKSPKVG